MTFSSTVGYRGSREGQLLQERLAVSDASKRLGRLGKHTGDLVGRSSFACRDHNKQLHDGVIDGRTTGLDDEDILITDTGQDANTSFALGKMSAGLASMLWLLLGEGDGEDEDEDEGEGVI